MPADVEWRMWRQLRGFGIDRFIFTPVIPEFNNIDIEQYPTMEEALEHCGEGNKVFLEPTGIKGMVDLPPRNEDVIFILGDTYVDNRKFTNPEESYRINEPMTTSMYPTSAAAIALAFWVGQ